MLSGLGFLYLPQILCRQALQRSENPKAILYATQLGICQPVIAMREPEEFGPHFRQLGSCGQRAKAICQQPIVSRAIWMFRQYTPQKTGL